MRFVAEIIRLLVRKKGVNAVLCNKLPSQEICAEEKTVVLRWDVGVVSGLALSWCYIRTLT